jgi:hypothetical protein
MQSMSILWLSCFLYYCLLVLLSALPLQFVVISHCKFQYSRRKITFMRYDLHVNIILICLDNCIYHTSGLALSCLYCIVRNFRGRKSSQISLFESILRKFSVHETWACPHPPIKYSTKEVFSLECFPLCGIHTTFRMSCFLSLQFM